MTVMSEPIAEAAERSPHRGALLAKVASVAAVVRENASVSEAARTLSRATFTALDEAGLFRSLLPEEVGGFQVDPVTEAELIEAVTALDGSAGWSFWALAGSTARAASMLPHTAEGDVFTTGKPFPLFAFQERPFGNKVHPTGHGLVVSGRWPFGTGVREADWVVAIGEVDRSVEPGPWPDAPMLAAAVPLRDVEIVDEWDAAGLAGTGTVDYRITDVVVPWRRVWPYPAEQVRGGAHFCFRRAPIKHTGFALGVARGILTGLTEHLTARLPGTGLPVDVIATEIATAQLALDTARAGALTTIGEVWREARQAGAVAETSHRRLRATARYVSEVATEIAGTVARLGDATMIARTHPVHRFLRDLAVGAAHGEISIAALPDYGRDLLHISR
jgi:alkylation response protein AidB-like acyl-CoA dehydrogenase